MQITDEMVDIALTTWFRDMPPIEEVAIVGGYQGMSISVMRSEMKRTLTAALAQAPTGVKARCHNCNGTGSPDYAGYAMDRCVYCGGTGEAHPDDLAVDRFALAMKAKLARKRAEGRSGWDDPDQCSTEFLSRLLHEHVEKGDPLDVGNLAMMLHQRDERILAALAPEPEAPDRGGHWEDDRKAWVGPVKGGQEPVATLSVFESAMCNGRKVGRILGWDSLLKGLPLGEHPLYTSPPQGQREGWRPIETAPKDGTYVLLANEHGTWVGKYVDRFTSGFKPENPWQTMMLNHRHMPRYCSTVPTHWMPLPASPTKEEDNG